MLDHIKSESSFADEDLRISKKSIQSLCAQLGFSEGHGYKSTPLPLVSLFRASNHESECPLLYESGLGFILEGYKLGLAAGQEFRTGGDRYLILSNNLAMRCETLATSSKPVLGIHVGIDRLELQRLVGLLSEDPKWNRQKPPSNDRAVLSARLTGDIREAIDTLIDILHDPIATRALGPATLTKLYFSVLLSEDGHTLKSLARSDSKLARISAAMRYMEQHLNVKVSMEELAAVSNLSLSAFHRAFKEVTGGSPLQYLKQLRLNTARNLMTHKGQPANVAARNVGYESANQFSREFKRYFGLPPSRVAELPYSTMTGVA